jgi:2-polyprenyl-3-methyl-5-hydroxy-6-metoxy-1,4-benzoquinol methylase
MVCTHGRIIRPEWLDSREAEEAAASLNDLIRINRLLGGHAVLQKSMAELVHPDESFTFLDVGAASGDMGASLQAEYPKARVTSFDYKLSHMASASGSRVCGDAFQMPFRKGSFDFVHCSLFLHHFPNEQVIELLKNFGAIARRAVVVTDLERNLLPYYFIPITKWLLGWDPITVHDAPISVEAAFSASELKQLATDAGLADPRVSVHRPAFRLALIAKSRN